MQKIAIIGANGFIGRHLLSALTKERVKVLSRKPVEIVATAMTNVEFHHGDLLQPASLQAFIEDNDIVVNLAYLSQGTQEENLQAIKNLAEICVVKKVKRILHCSTVVVSGSASENVLNEDSPCFPVTDYQITKYAIEQLLLSYCAHFEVIILRPGAVFGPGGQNLLKLARDLQHGSRLKNYMKSCLFGLRAMNLVAVDNVVAVIRFFINASEINDKNVFFITDDEDKDNNYRAVESYLLSKFYGRQYLLPVIKIPEICFRVLSILFNKRNINPKQIYLTKNLPNEFKKVVKFSDALKNFTDWYVGNNNESFER